MNHQLAQVCVIPHKRVELWCWQMMGWVDHRNYIQVVPVPIAFCLGLDFASGLPFKIQNEGASMTLQFSSFQNDCYHQ